MSLMRLLESKTLACGCVTGTYRETGTSREVTYVEDKGVHCSVHGHRTNHVVASDLRATQLTALAFTAFRAS